MFAGDNHVLVKIETSKLEEKIIKYGGIINE